MDGDNKLAAIVHRFRSFSCDCFLYDVEVVAANFDIWMIECQFFRPIDFLGKQITNVLYSTQIVACMLAKKIECKCNFYFCGKSGKGAKAGKRVRLCRLGESGRMRDNKSCAKRTSTNDPPIIPGPVSVCSSSFWGSVRSIHSGSGLEIIGKSGEKFWREEVQRHFDMTNCAPKRIVALLWAAPKVIARNFFGRRSANELHAYRQPQQIQKTIGPRIDFPFGKTNPFDLTTTKRNLLKK